MNRDNSLSFHYLFISPDVKFQNLFLSEHGIKDYLPSTTAIVLRTSIGVLIRWASSSSLVFPCSLYWSYFSLEFLHYKKCRYREREPAIYNNGHCRIFISFVFCILCAYQFCIKLCNSSLWFTHHEEEEEKKLKSIDPLIYFFMFRTNLLIDSKEKTQSSSWLGVCLDWWVQDELHLSCGTAMNFTFMKQEKPDEKKEESGRK
jgi:hypothetical protein